MTTELISIIYIISTFWKQIQKEKENGNTNQISKKYQLNDYYDLLGNQKKKKNRTSQTFS
jgi:hypothetical protein